MDKAKLNRLFKIKNHSGWWVIIGFLFSLCETDYFLKRDGYHFYPVTTEEIVCDVISFILTIGGLIVYITMVIRIAMHYTNNDRNNKGGLAGS